ncbi:MAG: hypothetical protein IJF98_01980 [Firmicutes bacterium]|nr:hypothetical protein [Bacillota bacterium]MBQ7241870.1 hypothetical protein [Bacillota bacterium]MBR0104363.1 hypothetical protein [Bacillota bacterium]
MGNFRRILAAGIVCGLIFSCSGCGQKTSKADKTDITAQIVDEEVNDMSAGSAEPSAVSQRDIDKMILPIDAAICSEWERGLRHNDKSDEVIWSALMYIMWDYVKSADTQSDAVISISKEKLMDYAADLFYGLERLPQRIPETYQYQISYSENDNTYIITPSYRENTETKLGNFTENADGTYTGTADLYSTDTNELLATWEVILAPNPGYSTESSLSTKLSIKELNLQEVRQTEKTFAKSATFLGLTDSHTVEVQFVNGELAQFQFYDEDVAGKLSGLFEGNEFAFSYTMDRETGISEITQIY